MTFTTDPATGKRTIVGSDALTLELGLYDTGGELRNQVLGLQAWVRTLIGEDPNAPTSPATPPKKKGLFRR